MKSCGRSARKAVAKSSENHAHFKNDCTLASNSCNLTPLQKASMSSVFKEPQEKCSAHQFTAWPAKAMDHWPQAPEMPPTRPPA
eukprot:444851-Alexandrium_andersonii.AAC.1